MELSKGSGLNLTPHRGQIERLIGVALATLTLVAAVPRAAGADEVIDRVYAVAAGDLITQSDVTAARDLVLVSVPVSEGQGSQEAQTRAIVSRLVDRALMLAEVERYAPPEPTAEAVDGEVQAVRARFASAQAFEATLARSGLDDKYLREILRQNLRIAAYVNERFAVPDDQRRVLVADWVAALRRRAAITELDLNAR